MIDYFTGRFVDGRIECSVSLSEISESVLTKGVALLTGVFDPDALAKLRQTVFEWSLTTAPQLLCERSFHRIDHLPSKSESPHIFHAYNLYLRNGAIDPDLENSIRPYAMAMKELQNGITNNNADFEPNEDGYFLRPQLIQYPSGGGFFASHLHPYRPQQIGLIVSLSQQGVDFVSGGTWFEFGDEIISIDGRHNMGDIALFKYDIPHGIAEVDAGKQLDWSSPCGKWSMVLPIIR